MPLDIVPVAAESWLWVAGVGLALPVVVVWVAANIARRRYPGVGTVVTGAAFAVTLIALAVTAFMASVMRVHHARLEDGTLVVRASRIYEARIALSDLELARAAHGVAAARREHGFDVPGYRVGWFRLADGRRAFVLATAAESTRIPSRFDYDLLVSFRDGDAALHALRQAAQQE
jgi:hypothetical protein